jgi:CxxC-x17-CxxC domain-containing protein
MGDFRSFDKDKREGRSGGSQFGGRDGGDRRGGRRFGGGRNFGGSRGGFGGRGRDSGRDRRELPQCDAVCAKCGKNCKVPFKPTGDKPVYCSDCFGGSERAPRSSTGSSSSGSGITTAQFDQLNKKLDKILEILKDAEISDEEESEEEAK